MLKENKSKKKKQKTKNWICTISNIVIKSAGSLRVYTALLVYCAGTILPAR